MTLGGKTAIVTGGSRGIGRAVVEVFSENGANVVACNRHITGDDSRALNGMKNVSFLQCDVTNEQDIQNVVSYTLDTFGQIDILANVAGISPKRKDGMKIPFYEQSGAQWREVMDTNLNSMFYFSSAVVPSMIDRRYGRIINMSSIVGLTNSEHGPASAAYVTSKTGVVGLTRAMAYDLAPYGITVNAIAPGRIATAMSAANNPYYNELHKKMIPMHRFGTPEEVAELFLFFASDKSAYITGETTNITGGWFI